jgi:hypothetical protein
MENTTDCTTIIELINNNTNYLTVGVSVFIISESLLLHDIYLSCEKPEKLSINLSGHLYNNEPLFLNTESAKFAISLIASVVCSVTVAIVFASLFYPVSGG